MMKSLLMIVLTTMMTVSMNVQALDLGDSMPAADVKMKNVDGNEITLAGVAGDKGTLVLFSCNHCPFVVAWEGRITELGNTYREKGIGVVQVNANDPQQKSGDTFEVMQQRAQARGFQFPYVVDATSNVARAFGATRTPEAFLFDAAGKLVYHGTIDDNYKSEKDVKTSYLKDALEAVIGGAAVPRAETKAVGCGIKFRPAS